ncbi:MAG: phosphorylase family protein [Acidiferrobacter sp.]
MTATAKNTLRCALLATALTIPALACAAPPYRPKVVVLTAFPPEFRVWQATGQYDHSMPVPGLPHPMICDTHRICVAITGEGEINAAMHTTAIVRDPALDCRGTLFIRSGIAGGVQSRAALGSVYLANWIVSWGFGHHYLTRSGHLAWAPPQPPYAHNPWDTLAYRVAPHQLSAAYNATRAMPLANSAAVLPLDAALNLHRRPHVYEGANVSGDDFWIGQQNERIARHIVALYTHNTAHYATTAMEDLGDIAALAAFGLQHHYLSVRAVSDIDVPPPAISVGAIIAKGDEYAGSLAARNAYLVTKRIIARLVLHRS